MDHIEVTAAGFTHWSSSPGSRTFDPECGACWEQYAHKLEAAQHALDSATFRERPAPGLVAACLRALQKYKEFQAVDPRDVEGAHKAFTEWLSLAADAEALASETIGPADSRPAGPDPHGRGIV